MRKNSLKTEKNVLKILKTVPISDLRNWPQYICYEKCFEISFEIDVKNYKI